MNLVCFIKPIVDKEMANDLLKMKSTRMK